MQEWRRNTARNSYFVAISSGSMAPWRTFIQGKAITEVPKTQGPWKLGSPASASQSIVSFWE